MQVLMGPLAPSPLAAASCLLFISKSIALTSFHWMATDSSSTHADTHVHTADGRGLKSCVRGGENSASPAPQVWASYPRLSDPRPPPPLSSRFPNAPAGVLTQLPDLSAEQAHQRQPRHLIGCLHPSAAGRSGCNHQPGSRLADGGVHVLLACKQR